MTKPNHKTSKQSIKTQPNTAISFNRAGLIAFFNPLLQEYLTKISYQPSVRVWLSGIFDQNIHYTYSLQPEQPLTVSMPAGNQVLTYNQSSSTSDLAGLDGDMGQMTLAPTLQASLSIDNNTIQIIQHLQIYCNVRILQSVTEANVVDVTITDTYPITVNNGILTATEATATSDNSSMLDTGLLSESSDLNNLLSDIQQWKGAMSPTHFTQIPLCILL